MYNITTVSTLFCDFSLVLPTCVTIVVAFSVFSSFHRDCFIGLLIRVANSFYHFLSRISSFLGGLFLLCSVLFLFRFIGCIENKQKVAVNVYTAYSREMK